MNMLKAHLYERRLQERKDEMNQIVGEQKILNGDHKSAPMYFALIRW